MSKSILSANSAIFFGAAHPGRRAAPSRYVIPDGA